MQAYLPTTGNIIHLQAYGEPSAMVHYFVLKSLLSEWMEGSA